ncbi:Hypothetical predicted protein [Olea europaea subsp. europaea]|uniref:Uncharacterized protein n=1 Tax=Olea europaea subsp. europaea TaxID=158383 RepID=A0A8S0U773_OLEEU|nr:Hypothetical predicted protein [Olea europaea subsp. europaea]
MIRAFEAIPTLGMKFAAKDLDLEVNSTLIPTEVELDEAYWKELKPIMEEDESASHHSEVDEVEHDAEPQHAFNQHSSIASQPPSISHEINIVYLLRTEMEKLEGRLQPVISTRLVQVEKKVDRLEKEARFDDVTDVLADEKKVEESEEDPKLEEKVKGKNEGGNEVETGSGNDIEEQ